MEETRPGQQPEADRPPADPQQNSAARAGGGEAAGGLAPTDLDRARIEAADRRGADAAAAMKADGFGDHKGVEGFPGADRSE